tara:strand:- start:1205 stop:2293 length:1089 start_codon:yes stop_codon:yes gene_type:complete
MTKAAELAKMGEVLTNSQIGGRRNILINGGMNVAQRGTSETGVGAADGFFTCDRWGVYQGGTAGRLTMTQDSSGPSGFANSLKLDCTTADTSIAAGEYFAIYQRLEGQDVQQIKKGTSDAENITVSFYVKGNASATYAVELFDNDNTRQASQLFSVTTDWTRVVKTFTADTTGAFDDDNAQSLQLNFWIHAGSNLTSGTLNQTFDSNTNANRAVGISSFFDSTDRTFFLTGVQLEVGSQATPFEHRSFAEELKLCQRYFFTTYEVGATIGAASSVSFLGRFIDATHSYASIQVPHVAMRSSPTRVIYNTATGATSSLRSDSNNHAAAITGTNANGNGWIYANASSIGTSVSVKAHLTMEAEL